MWNPLVIFLFVGITVGLNSSWRPEREYIFQIQSRTYSGFPELRHQFAGVVGRGQLVLHTPRGSNGDVLLGKLQNYENANFNEDVSDVYLADIRQDRLKYQPSNLNEKPFRLFFTQGTLEKIEVDQSMSNDEANQLKAILTQLQFDMQGKNLIPWEQNQLPKEENGLASGLYLVMEPSIVGRCEAVYKVSPVANFAVPDSFPYYVESLPISGQDPVFQVEKTINFDNCVQSRGFNHGVYGRNVHANQIGQFLSRKLTNRMIASGSPSNFTIHYSKSAMRVAAAPELYQKQTAVTTSSVELFLVKVSPYKEALRAPTQPQNVGSLVYRYNIPSDRTNQARVGPDYANPQERSPYNQNKFPSQYDTTSEEIDELRLNNRPYFGGVQGQNRQEHQYDNFLQPDAPIEQSPEHPLLPYYVGNKGRAIRFDVNIVDEIEAHTSAIAESLRKIDQISQQHTLERFNILVNLVASANYKDILTVNQRLESKLNASGYVDTHGWHVFRDAVTLGGTGPTTLMLSHWLSTGNWENIDAYAALVMQPKVITVPTEEQIKVFLNMVKSEQIVNQRNIYSTALFTLAELVNRAYSHRRNVQNLYPEDSYGPFRPRLTEIIEKQVVPYFEQSLRKAFESKNDRDILMYTKAYGNLGHPSFRGIFKEYYEQKSPLPAFQRAALILALDSLSTVDSELVQPVLYNIYTNVAEDPDVRSVAVMCLIKTNPGLALLQQIASFTNEDPSIQVQSLVKYTIENTAKLENVEDKERASKAQSAVHFLNPRSYSNAYSTHAAYAKVFKNLNFNRKKRVGFLTNTDSQFPNMVSLHVADLWGGLYEEQFHWRSYVSSVEDLLKHFNWPKTSSNNANDDVEIITTGVNNSLNGNEEGMSQIPMNLPPQLLDLVEQFHSIVFGQQFPASEAPNLSSLPKYSPMQKSPSSNEKHRLQGFSHYKLFGGTKYDYYDENTMKNLPEMLDRFVQSYQNGRRIHFNKFYKDESVTIAFPLNTGYPYIYKWDKPVLYHMSGNMTFQVNTPFSDGSSPIVNIPSEARMSARAAFTCSTNHITQSGFITPNNGKQYVAGHVRRVMHNLPINVNINVDLRNHKVTGAIMPVGKAVLAHFSSVPYTAEKDAFSVNPDTGNQRNVLIVHAHKPKVVKRRLGNDSTGLILSIQGQYERQDGISGPVPYLVGGVPLSSLWEVLFQPSEGLEAYDIEVMYSDLDTKTDGLQFGFAMKSGVIRGSGKNSNASPVNLEGNTKAQKYGQASSFNSKKPRQQRIAFLQDVDELFENLTPVVPVARATVVSAWVVFAGPGTQTVYEVAGSYLTSQPTGVTQITGRLRRNELNYFNEKQYCFELNVKEPANTAYATSSLDKALEENRQLGLQLHLTIGPDCVSGDRHPNNTGIFGIALMNQTQDYKQQVLSNAVARQCKEDSTHGNLQSPACRKAIEDLRVPNTVTFQLEQTGSDRYIKDILEIIACQQHNPIVKDTILHQQDIKRVMGTLQLGQDSKFFDGIVQYGDLQYQVNDLEITPLIRTIAFDEPIYDQLPFPKPIQRESVCVVDTNQITTFNGAMHNNSIGQCSYTVAQTVNLNNGLNSSPVTSAYNRDVTVMMADKNGVPYGREVTILLDFDPKGTIVRLHLNGRGTGLRPTVTLLQNDSTRPLQPDQHTEVTVGGVVKAHVHPQTALDDNVVVVDIDGGSMRIVFNGEWIRVEADPSYRNKLRGLCGTNNLEPFTDKVSPRGCVYRDPKYFIDSWANSEELSFCRSDVKQDVADAQNAECFPIEYVPNAVVNSYQPMHSYGSTKSGSNLPDQSVPRSTPKESVNNCQLVKQIQYVSHQGQTCFSTKPLSSCPQHCLARHEQSLVEVYCYNKNDPRVRAHIQAINKGQHRVNWGTNTVRKTLEFNIPTTCRRY